VDVGGVLSEADSVARPGKVRYLYTAEASRDSFIKPDLYRSPDLGECVNPCMSILRATLLSRGGASNRLRGRMATLYLVPMDSFLGPWRSGICVQTRKVSTNGFASSILQSRASMTHRDLLNCALLQDLLNDVLLFLCLTKLAVKSGLGRIVVWALGAMPIELTESAFVLLLGGQ